MANAMGPSTFLPAIKCSMCAQKIEISLMEEHICGGFREATPPPDSILKSLPLIQREVPKQRQMRLPYADTSLANRSVTRQDQLPPTPSSINSLSPCIIQRPWSLHRGRTSPLQPPLLPRSTSPDTLSPNLDCAFPPWGTTIVAPRKVGDSGKGNMHGDFDMYASVSPRIATGGRWLQRMDAIASGPFGVNPLPKVDSPMFDGYHHHRRLTAESLRKEVALPSQGLAPGYGRKPSTASGHSQELPNRLSEASSRASRQSGYRGSFRSHSDEELEQERLRPDQRSKTFPLSNESQDVPARRPSEPIHSVNSKSTLRNHPVSGSGLSRPLPPRGLSILQAKAGASVNEVPPVLANLAAEFGISNPYHTPTTSQSSSTSRASRTSKVSSRLSAPSTSPKRQPRDVSAEDHLAELTSKVHFCSEDIPHTDMLRIPTQSEDPPLAVIEQARTRPVPRSLSSHHPSQPPKDPHNECHVQATFRSRSPVSLPLRSQARSGTHPLISPLPLNPPRRPSDSSILPTTAKGVCKGCNLPIKGKSVSSADGRLTGRYHKPCFVCTSCSTPFTTSEFYVLKDKPYCQRHYHELNGSLCSICDSGIEGVYLDGENGMKFHEACLRCKDCGVGLLNGYFDMGGRVLCADDAWKTEQEMQERHMHRGGSRGGLKSGARSPMAAMEKRSTRLMMM